VISPTCGHQGAAALLDPGQSGRTLMTKEEFEEKESSSAASSSSSNSPSSTVSQRRSLSWNDDSKDSWRTPPPPPPPPLGSTLKAQPLSPSRAAFSGPLAPPTCLVTGSGCCALGPGLLVGLLVVGLLVVGLLVVGLLVVGLLVGPGADRAPVLVFCKDSGGSVFCP